MPDVAPKPVSGKMGVEPGARALLVGAPESAVEAMHLPVLDPAPDPEGPFDYIHLFTGSRADMDEKFPALHARLAPGGMLWVSWPKGRRGGTDLTLPEVIRIGYTHGLVESKCVSVDGTWSALKFTRPVRGKVYENSYGRLTGQ